VETIGDARLDLSISEIARQGVFTSEVEHAVIMGRADIAVHSAKDLPSSGLSNELCLAAAPVRADVRDVLVGATLGQLQDRSMIATGSMRRRIQLQLLVPDAIFLELRGNIATRLRKVPLGGAAVFAYAALDRLDLLEHVAEVLSVEMMLPQVGQGAIALRCRVDDERCRLALVSIDNDVVHRALLAERAYLGELGGGCEAPVGAYAQIDTQTGEISLEAMYGSLDGPAIVRMNRHGNDPVELGTKLAREIMAKFDEISKGDKYP
jgi:hydroxymethylbilane synthase